MIRKNLSRRNISIFFLPIVVVTACETESAKQNDDEIDTGTIDTSQNTPSTDRSIADAMTHATPQITEKILDSNHAGWNTVNCLSCHETLHTSGYESVSQCATCHGANGAGLVPHDDHRTDCSECHADSHSDIEFGDTQQCLTCHLAYNPQKKAECSHKDSYDVIIVGAGGGGLAAASTLLAAGKRVLVLEQHYKTGGAMVSFRRGDYNFEASLHAFDGMSFSYLKSLGIFDRLEFSEGEYMYRSVYPDFTIDIPADTEEYKKTLIKQFPDYATQLENLFQELVSMNLFDYLDKSVLDLMDEFGIDDIKLITVLTQLVGFIGAALEDINASLYMGMWTSFHSFGYYYLTGGSQAITNALTDSVLEQGGDILLNTLVTKIVIENGQATGVKTANGDCFDADYVISNANQPDTYLKLVGQEHLPAQIVADLQDREYTFPVSLVYLGVDRDYTEYFPGGAHEYWVNRRYADEWFSEGPQCDPEEGLTIANYSVLDPTAAPEGKNVIALTFLIDYDCHDQWRLGLSYDEYKKYKADLAEYYIALAEEHLPELRKHAEVIEVASPSTVELYTLNPKGTWAGWYLESDITPLNLVSPEGHRTPIQRLYQAGAWAATGGQSVVLSSGMMAANLVLEDMNAE